MCSKFRHLVARLHLRLLQYFKSPYPPIFPHLCPFGSLHSAVSAALADFHHPLSPTADQAYPAWPFVRHLLDVWGFLPKFTHSGSSGDLGEMAWCSQKLMREGPGWGMPQQQREQEHSKGQLGQQSARWQGDQSAGWRGWLRLGLPGMAELCTMLLVQLELPRVAASLCHATEQGLLVAPESKEAACLHTRQDGQKGRNVCVLGAGRQLGRTAAKAVLYLIRTKARGWEGQNVEWVRLWWVLS